jgi:uncharacterized protein YndB with AHSA1/START domain
MAKIEESVIIDCQVEDVWNLISDISKLKMWDTTISEAKLTSSGPLGVGATCEVKAKMRNMTISMRVIGYEPNRKFMLEHTSGPAKGSIITFSMETTKGKTRFTNSSDLKFSGFYKLLAFSLVPRMKKDTISSLGNVKRILESQVQS